MWSLANPTNFIRWSSKLLPILIVATIICFTIGLYMSWLAPDDYQQGATVKIMFIHVPAAWLSQFCYGVMIISSFGTLVWRHPMADVSAKAAAPLGMVFTFLTLVTGSLWGKPMWGTWWEWDARMTSSLLLFFLYIGITLLWQSYETMSKAGRIVAILTLAGTPLVFLVKFSVEYWNTLHQPASVIRMEGSAIHPSILWPLLIMVLAYSLLFLTLHMLLMRNEVFRRRVKSMQLQALTPKASTATIIEESS